MQEAGVDPDHERRAGNQPRHLIERLPLRHPRMRRGLRDAHGTLALGLVAVRHDEIDVAAAEHRGQHPPVLLRPFLSGLRGRVQQHAVGLGRARRETCAVEAEVRRSLARIAQRLGGQRAVARNRVLLPFDRMLDVVEPRRRGLLDALAVVAAPPSLRITRDQRRLEQPLRVDDLVERPPFQRTAERRHLTPRRWPATASGASAGPPPGSPRRPPDAARTSGANASSTTQEKRTSGRCARASVSAGM